MTATIKTNQQLAQRVAEIKEAQLQNMSKTEFHFHKLKFIRYNRIHRQLFGY